MIKGGVVIEITKLKNHVVAVANAIPTSRTYNGNASAEYCTDRCMRLTSRTKDDRILLTVSGTGPSPGEYAAVNRYMPSAIIPILAGFDSGIQLHGTHHRQLNPMQKQRRRTKQTQS